MSIDGRLPFTMLELRASTYDDADNGYGADDDDDDDGNGDGGGGDADADDGGDDGLFFSFDRSAATTASPNT